MREKGAHDVSDLGLASSRQRKGFQPRLDVHRLYLVAGFNGYQAALVRRQLTPVLISSLCGAAGLLRLIFFRQSSLQMDSTVAARTRERIVKVRATGSTDGL